MGNKEEWPEAVRNFSTRHGYGSNVIYLLKFLLQVTDDLDIIRGQDGWEGAKCGKLESLTSKI